MMLLMLFFYTHTQARTPDWWIVMKHPGGRTYEYADSDSPTFVNRLDEVDAPETQLGRLMQRYFEVKNGDGVGGLIAWNDGAKPRGRKLRGTRNCQIAHSKGFLLVDENGGELLTHSVPKFAYDESPFFPIGGRVKAQHLLYISLSTRGVEDFVTHVLKKLWPMVHDTKWHSSLVAIYPHLNLVMRYTSRTDWDIGSPMAHADLISKAGTKFVVVIKPCGEEKSIFEYVANNVVRGPILAQSFLQSPIIYSTPSVRNVCFLRGSSGSTPWRTTKDHSKFIVSKCNSYVGVGDLNRKSSQYGRGGMFFLLHHQGLHTSFRNRIVNFVQTCEEQKYECTSPRIRNREKDDFLCEMRKQPLHGWKCMCSDEECCKDPSVGLPAGVERMQTSCQANKFQLRRLSSANTCVVVTGNELVMLQCSGGSESGRIQIQTATISAEMCKRIAWGAESQCTKPCGGGTQSFRRICTVDIQAPCREPLQETRPCNTGVCEHCGRASPDGKCGPKHGGRICDPNVLGWAQYCNVSTGLCGPTNSQTVYDFEALTGCGGCPSSTDDNYICLDRTSCSGLNCCDTHGGIERCPAHIPFMCKWAMCGSNLDHCCVAAPTDCDTKGGVLRACPSSRDNDTGLQAEPSMLTMTCASLPQTPTTSNKGMIIGIVVAGIAVILSAAACAIYIYRNRTGDDNVQIRQ